MTPVVIVFLLDRPPRPIKQVAIGKAARDNPKDPSFFGHEVARYVSVTSTAPLCNLRGSCLRLLIAMLHLREIHVCTTACTLCVAMHSRGDKHGAIYELNKGEVLNAQGLAPAQISQFGTKQCTLRFVAQRFRRRHGLTCVNLCCLVGTPQFYTLFPSRTRQQRDTHTGSSSTCIFWHGS